MTLYVASYGHRFSDPSGTFVSRDRDALEDAIEAAVEYERSELPGYCTIPHDELLDYGNGRVELIPESDCSFCNPDVVSYGIWPMFPSDLGSIATACELLDAFRLARLSGSKVAALDR